MSGIVSSVDSRSQAIDASGQLRLANANFFFLIASTANVSVVFSRGGSTETYALQVTGLQIGRVKPWDYAFITGAPGTIVTFFYGYANLREDVTDFRQALATISGTVAVAINPAATLTDVADVSQASGTQTAIGANLARKRITIGVLSTSLNSVRVSFVGGAARGIELQPGTFQEFDNTAALIVRNDNTFGGAGAATWYSEEET